MQSLPQALDLPEKESAGKPLEGEDLSKDQRKKLKAERKKLKKEAKVAKQKQMETEQQQS